jgi:hypothetical protein
VRAVYVVGVDTGDRVVPVARVVHVVRVVRMVGVQGGRVQVVGAVNIVRAVDTRLDRRKQPEDQYLCTGGIVCRIFVRTRIVSLTLYPVGSARMGVENASAAPRKTAMESMLLRWG